MIHNGNNCSPQSLYITVGDNCGPHHAPQGLQALMCQKAYRHHTPDHSNVHAETTPALVSAQATAGNHAATVGRFACCICRCWHAHCCHGYKSSIVLVADTSEGTHMHSVAICEGHFYRPVLHVEYVDRPPNQNPATVLTVTHLWLHRCQPIQNPVRASQASAPIPNLQQAAAAERPTQGAVTVLRSQAWYWWDRNHTAPI